MNHDANQQFNNYAQNASQEDVGCIEKNLGGMQRGAIAKLWSDVQCLYSMVVDPSAAWASKAVAIGALIYLVSPIDAVPDFIPVLGLGDDAGVIVAACASLAVELSRYRKS